MSEKERSNQRREDSLSRERIIEASIEILDKDGERGLTFRALAEKLATGAGAIYWHIANKSDLLTAACDAMVAQAMENRGDDASTQPAAHIRTLALRMFDLISTRPWIGSALMQAPGQLPIMRILEVIGQQVRALGVPDDKQWTVASALLNYILGVSGQDANNEQIAQKLGLDRGNFLGAISASWSQLDANEYPFLHSMSGQLKSHDDRMDFLAGIDLILSGAEFLRRG